jgi:hypothetical protein
MQGCVGTHVHVQCPRAACGSQIRHEERRWSADVLVQLCPKLMPLVARIVFPVGICSSKAGKLALGLCESLARRIELAIS